MSTQHSDKLENVFLKVEPIKQLKVGGGEAQVLFMNTKHKKNRSEDKSALLDKKNDFISDGGLKERSMKYYNSTTFNKTNMPPKSKIVFFYIFRILFAWY